MNVLRMFPIVLVTGLALASLPLCGCEESPRSGGSTNPASLDNAVVTTFYPTMYFAQRIAGGLVPVKCPLPEREDPIFWQPDQGTISQYQNARLVITNGIGFEKWAAGAALPRARTVESLTEADLKDGGGAIVLEKTTHSHGPAGKHTHEGLDAHTWVSPTLAKVQARRIAEAMKEAWPDHASAFDANLAPLLDDLEMLRASLADLTSRVQDNILLASHPAYNYLARDLGWTITTVTLDPEGEDAPPAVDAVRHAIGGADKGSILMLWEAEPTDPLRTALQEQLGVTSVVFSPVEGQPGDGDYLDAMRANIDRLRRAVGG